MRYVDVSRCSSLNIFANKSQLLNLFCMLIVSALLSACDKVTVVGEEGEIPDDNGYAYVDYDPPPAALVSLDDINGDGVQDVAVVRYDPIAGRLNAIIKDVNGSTVKRFPFSGNFRLLKALALPDMNSNGAMELAVFAQHVTSNTLKVEIRDSASGGYVRTIWYNNDNQLLFATTMADMNDGTYPELVALFRGPISDAEPDGTLFAQIVDPLSGAQISNIFFNKRLSAVSFVSLQDANNSGTPELALLGQRKSGEYRKVIKDAGGGPDDPELSNKGFGTGIVARQFALVPDMNGDGLEDLAVLRVDSGVRVPIFDTDKEVNALSAQTISTVFFSSNLTPQKLVVLPDFSGNGQPELAILAFTQVPFSVQAQVKDASGTGGAINLFWSAEYPPFDMIAIPDSNNNGSQELVTLGQRQTDGKLLVSIKDAKTNEQLGTLGGFN